MSSSDRHTAVRRPATAMPFRLHASVTCPPPGRARDLAGVGARRPRRRPRRACAVRAGRRRPGRGRARPARRSCARWPRSSPARRCPPAPTGELLIDRVLERGHGHPVLFAIVLDELGRRAGLPVGIIAGERGHFVAHQRLTEPLVLDPATGRLLDADDARHAALAVRPPGRRLAARPPAAALRARRRPHARAAGRAPALHAAVRGHGRGRAAPAPASPPA